MKIITRTILFGCSLFMAFTVNNVFETGIFIGDAQARVGRPMTPISVAGAARRTTRRVIRRTTVYVPTLPGGCTTVVVEGMTLHQCGNKYYQPYENQFVVVVIE